MAIVSDYSEDGDMDEEILYVSSCTLKRHSESVFNYLMRSEYCSEIKLSSKANIRIPLFGSDPDFWPSSDVLIAPRPAGHRHVNDATTTCCELKMLLFLTHLTAIDRDTRANDDGRIFYAFFLRGKWSRVTRELSRCCECVRM